MCPSMYLKITDYGKEASIHVAGKKNVFRVFFVEFFYCLPRLHGRRNFDPDY